MIKTIVDFDKTLALFMNEHVTSMPVLWFFNFFSIIGNGAACWILLFIVFSIAKSLQMKGSVGRKPIIKIWLCWIIPFLAIYLISELGIKHLVARPRPFIALEGINMLATKINSYSFPSSHSAFSAAALYLVYKLKVPPNRIPWVIIAVMIPVSRFVLNAHFLSDVIAGCLIGFLLSWVVLKLLETFLFSKPGWRSSNRSDAN